MERCTQALRALGMALDRDGGVGKRYTGSEWSIYGFMAKGGGRVDSCFVPKWMENRDDDLVWSHWTRKFVPMDGRRFIVIIK